MLLQKELKNYLFLDIIVISIYFIISIKDFKNKSGRNQRSILKKQN